MKIPSFRRLVKTNFPEEYQGLVELLAVSINYGFEVLYEALNKKISLQDNILCTIKDIEVEVDINGNPKTTTGFLLDITGKIQGMVVLNALNLTNSTTYPSSGIFCSFIQSNNSIIINNVTGLQANNLYKLKLVAFG